MTARSLWVVSAIAALAVAQVSTPDDFVPVPEARLADFVRCAKLSPKVVQVQSTGGGVDLHLETASPSSERFSYGPRLSVPLGDAFQQRGEWRTLEDDSGWLVGVNRGEWGGALWSVPRSGGEPRRIVGGAVLALGRSEPGTYVVTYDHHDFDRRLDVSALRILRRDGREMWQVESVHTFDGFLTATYDGGAEGLFLLTTRQVLRQRGQRLQVVAQAQGIPDDLGPYTLAADSTSVYVGMHLLVVRIEMSNAVQHWLVPRTCLTFTQETQEVTMEGIAGHTAFCRCSGI
jgi:hypothetical protein